MAVTPVDQLTAGGQYPHEDCGECCVASILIDAGKADTVRDIEYYDWAHGDDPADGTSGAVHVSRLQAAGLVAYESPGDWLVARQRLMDRGYNRALVAIFSDGYGYPTPGGIGHWLLWAGGSTYMQPVGGLVVNYPDGLVQGASQQYQIVCNVNLGLQPTPMESTNMTPQEVAAVVKLAYVQHATAHFPPDSPQVLAALQQDVNDAAGFDHQVAAVLNKGIDLHGAVNNILSS